MRRFFAVVVLLFTLSACATGPPPTPAQQLAAIELTFTGVVEQLTLARIDGIIEDDSVWRCVQQAIRALDNTLDAAHVALTRDVSAAIYIGSLRASLRVLRRMEQTGECSQ